MATRLNRTHLLPGQAAYLLPCLVRAEADMQAGGPQMVSIEDSFSHVYGVYRQARARESACEIGGGDRRGLGQGPTLPANPRWEWDAWTGDYGLIRQLIAKTYPQEFHDMSARMNRPGGFYRGNPAHDRKWKTESGKAKFTAPTVLNASGVQQAEGIYTLVTLRSNDQFNTTVYGHSDRLRGIEGSRMIVLMGPEDMLSANLHDGALVTLVTQSDDGFHREVAGLAVTPYDLPRGCLAGYFPELNPLVPLDRHDKLSKTPAAKGIPVAIRTCRPAEAACP